LHRGGERGCRLGGAADLLGKGGWKKLHQADLAFTTRTAGARIAGALAEDQGQNQIVIESDSGTIQAALGPGFGQCLAHERAPVLDVATERQARCLGRLPWWACGGRDGGGRGAR
jgi:hypothetical protein